jgi:hypothetical protein
MSRFETQSPSLLERLFSGATFALGGAVLYAAWVHWQGIPFLEHRRIAVGIALGCFVFGFLAGVSRTAELFFKLAFPHQQDPLPGGRGWFYAVLVAGLLWAAVTYL